MIDKKENIEKIKNIVQHSPELMKIAGDKNVDDIENIEQVVSDWIKHNVLFSFDGIAYQALQATAGALLDQYIKIKPENDKRAGLYINRTAGAYAIIDKNKLLLNQYVIDNPDLKANGEATGIKLAAILNLLVELATFKGWEVLPSNELGDVAPNDKAVYNARKGGFTGSSLLD